MKYKYWLDNIEISSGKKQALLKEFQSAKEIYQTKEKEYEKIPGWQEKDTRKIKEAKRQWDLEKRAEELDKKGIRIITCEQEEYPERLRQIQDNPYALYVKGELPKEEQKSVAIVGARKCSEYGYYMAKKLGEVLGKNNVSVISGLADGIDSAGQRGAVNLGGSTYAVLGCGVDICYPKSNRILYEQIAKTGGILSEYPPGTQPKSYYFPARNRIISGLADVVVVMEAKKKSGSLITADLALEQGKEIYALPGRVTDALSFGCNRLIREGAGVLISVEDFLTDCNIVSERKENLSKNFKVSLAKEETLVYSCLGLEAKNIDDILEETGLSVSCVAGVLMKLQMSGAIRESFKNHYIKTEI